MTPTTNLVVAVPVAGLPSAAPAFACLGDEQAGQGGFPYPLSRRV